MRRGNWSGSGVLSLMAVAALVVAGCSQTQDTTDKGGKAEGKKENKLTKAESGHNYKGHDWCGEHGIPESVCSMCDGKVAAAFKKKADWCDKHDRALSQCFICNPQLKAKFAAEYKAKYGEDPPPTEDEEKESK